MTSIIRLVLVAASLVLMLHSSPSWGQTPTCSLPGCNPTVSDAKMGASSEGVFHLRPVTFAYKDDARKVTHYGLVAEEVAAVYPDLVSRTPEGEVQTVKYQELIPMLLNELQHQRREFQQALQRQQQESAEVAKLRQELAEIRALVGPRSGEATGPEKKGLSDCSFGASQRGTRH